MKYIIDEIELKNLIKSLLDIPDEEDIKDIEDDFLKDKKPVELIHKEKIKLDYTEIIFNTKQYTGKNIEIYIKEV